MLTVCGGEGQVRHSIENQMAVAARITRPAASDARMR
jgi:hypothetical protein